MKVYVVESCSYAVVDVDGVYATPELAMAAYPEIQWSKQIDGGWSGPRDKFTSARITEHEVKEAYGKR